MDSLTPHQIIKLSLQLVQRSDELIDMMNRLDVPEGEIRKAWERHDRLINNLNWLLERYYPEYPHRPV